MKIATMATGGIGGYLAVRMTQGGHQVATIARGDHLEAISDKGLTLDGPNGVETVRPWLATSDTSAVGEVDAIIFGVKGDALEAAATACLPMIGPDTLVVPFLNGVEASDRLAKILPVNNVGNGVAQISTTISEPGVIKQTGGIKNFIFAERDSRPSPRVDRLREAIISSGGEATPTDDIDRDLWLKFTFFSALSGITAAARCYIGDIKSNDALLDLFHTVANETAALGRARGVNLPASADAFVDNTLAVLSDQMRASTAVDLEHGRPLEINWISGAVARLSAELNMAAPANAALYAVLSPYKNGG